MADTSETNGSAGDGRSEGTALAPTPQPQPQPQPQGAPAEGSDSRPAPRYGEYAPEGWQWSPGAAAGGPSAEAAGVGDRPADASGAAGPSASAPRYGVRTEPGAPDSAVSASTGRDRSGVGPIPGVPHNLGARAAAAGSPAGASANGQQPERSYRAQPPQAMESPARPQHSSSTAETTGARRGRRGDRTATLVLIALGALGALYFAFTLQQMPQTFALMATILDADGFVVPDSVRTLSTVGAIVVLSIYALNVVLSLQRMRAGKLSFWVPLAAFALALIVLFAFSSIALSQMPQLLQVLADPGAVTTLFDSLGNGAG